jgi:hypothetical protein
MSSDMTDASGEVLELSPADLLRQRQQDRIRRGREIGAAMRQVPDRLIWGEPEVEIDVDLFPHLAARLRQLHLDWREYVQQYVGAVEDGQELPDYVPPPEPVIETIHLYDRIRVRQHLSWQPTRWAVRATDQSTLDDVSHTGLLEATGGDTQAVMVRVIEEE